MARAPTGVAGCLVVVVVAAALVLATTIDAAHSPSASPEKSEPAEAVSPSKAKASAPQQEHGSAPRSGTHVMEAGGGDAGAPNAEGATSPSGAEEPAEVEASFPPDAPIAGEAPLAEVTTPTDDESTPAEATVSEGPSEAPSPAADDQDSDAASVTRGGGVTAPLVFFTMAVVAVAAAL